MKRKFVVIVFALLFPLTFKAEACTNVIVTKGASADGSVMVSYVVDSHQLYGELYYTPAADWKAGSMMDVYNWDSGMYGGQIPQVEHTFQTVGNMNEHQLIITETTFGGREELAYEKGIVGYGTLIYTTLQRAKTAREAIAVIAEMAGNYGYVDEGETFSIADKEEAWVMEMVGKGDRPGAVWVAVRIPDGYISAHANCSRIHRFPLNDPDNCLYSPDVISFAREKGYFEGKDEEFSFCDAYCPASWDVLRGCESRVWSVFRLLGGGNFDADKYEDFARGANAANKMPLYIKPEKKVDLKALADVNRDHYEGTFMDLTEDVAAGPFRTPYRWRPIEFDLDGKTYCFERSIATQQTGFWYICQSRSWLPDEVGGVCWFGVDDTATSALTPIYTSVSRVPECFRVGNGDMMTYSPTSAFWLFNRVAHFAYLFYDRVIGEIREKIDSYENENLKMLADVDAKALRMVENGNRGQAVEMMTEWCCRRAECLFKTWDDMSGYLLVKYMDGNVKRQNEDGTFKDNGAGTGIPANPAHPEYRERWLRSVVNDCGKSIEVGK